MPKLSCGHTCLQIMLVVWNIILSLCGIALIVIGSLALVKQKKYDASNEAYIKNILIFLIALGSYMFLLGAFGVCGACCKIQCCLLSYIIMVLVFLLCGLGGGIAAFVLRSKINDYAVDIMRNAYEQYTVNDDIKNSLDILQKELSCCGLYGDWDENADESPSSCIDESTKTKHSKGCVDALKEYLKKTMLIFGICLFVFTLLQVLGLVFGICIYQELGRTGV